MKNQWAMSARRALLVLLIVLVMLSSINTTVAVTAAACDAPSKTLSSDCRGATYDANALCLVRAQSAACRANQSECASTNGPQSCEVLSFKVNYYPTQARFHIKFAGEFTPLASSAATRMLFPQVTRVDDRPIVVATAQVTATQPPTPPPTPPPPQATRVDVRPTLNPTTSGTAATGEPIVVTTRVTASQPPTSTPPPTTPPTSPRAPSQIIPPTTRADSQSTPYPTTSQTVASENPMVGPPSPLNGTSRPSFSPVPHREPTDAPPIYAALPSASNDDVDAIGVLRLDPALTELRLVGGTNEFGTRGRAVTITIDPGMLAQSQHVTSVWILNCNLGDQLASGNILGGMPTGLTDLNLRNTMMRAEPRGLSALQNLRSLKMEQNYLTNWSKNISLQKLTSLDLTENALASFDAYLPAIESLYLSKNNLSAIPNVVYAMSKLQELYLTENPIIAVVVSASQYAFLNNLRLKIDRPPSTPPEPVIYVAGQAGNSSLQGLVLDDKNADIRDAVAAPVGTLTDLQGVPVWELSDALHEVFTTQQNVITTSDVVIRGKKAVSYQAIAAAAIETIPKPSRNSSQNSDVPAPLAGDPAISPAKSLTSTTHHKLMTLSLAIVGVVAAFVAGFLIVRRRRRRNTKDSISAVATPQDGSSLEFQEAPPVKSIGSRDRIDSHSAFALATHQTGVRDLLTARRIRMADLEDVRIIGAGSMCVVWLVKFRGSRHLASKRLIHTAATHQQIAQFLNEIVIAADLDHPCILDLVGVAWTSKTDLQALFEYMPNGDLQTYLYCAKAGELSWVSTKLKLAMDIVEALVYTHSFNPPLLHRDLRTRNVLLDEDMNPKLSNFGSARFASEQNTMTTDGVGSGRWLAPEILAGSTDYDSASDMYAFGVLLCELDTHMTPYAGVCDSNGSPMGENELLTLVAQGEMRPMLSGSCPLAIRDLVDRCLSPDPATRPMAMRVAYELRSLKREWEKVSEYGIML